jgi:WS/DGAT/MGAT family acyltransferase
VTDWVKGRDAVFFMLEGRATPYHMASLLIFDGEVPDRADIEAEIRARLDVMPRSRQRVEWNRLAGRYEWVDDDEFDMTFHVRYATVPAPGTDFQLKATVATLMEQHLNRHRPLWELWVLDGLIGDRFAILFKVHHAATDGATGARVLERVFAQVPSPLPSSAPSRRSLSLPSPRRALEGAIQLIDGSASMVRSALAPAPTTPFNGRIGPNRRMDFADAPLEDFKAIKRAFGASINDVFLAVVTQGLRTWYIRNGHPIDVTLRALVPIALHPENDRALFGNSVTGILVPLPLDEPDSAKRLMKIHEDVRSPRVRAEASVNKVLLDLPTVVPYPIASSIVRVQSVQRFFNLSLTNMRGPEQPLYLLGRRAVEIVAIPPLSANAGLIVAAFSYAGSMTLGLLSDPKLVPDLGTIAEAMEKEVVHLLSLA